MCDKGDVSDSKEESARVEAATVKSKCKIKYSIYHWFNMRIVKLYIVLSLLAYYIQ